MQSSVSWLLWPACVCFCYGLSDTATNYGELIFMHSSCAAVLEHLLAIHQALPKLTSLASHAEDLHAT